MILKNILNLHRPQGLYSDYPCYKVAQHSGGETNLKFFWNEPTELFALYLHLCGLILENFQICLASRVLRDLVTGIVTIGTLIDLIVL